MRHLIHFTLIYSAAILIVAVVQKVRHNHSLPLYLGIPLFLALEVGTRVFLVSNLGKSVGLGEGFNFLGLHVVVGAAVLALILSVMKWQRDKTFLPYGILAALSVLQIIVTIVLYLTFAGPQ
jgi:hypothetical protein